METQGTRRNQKRRERCSRQEEKHVQRLRGKVGGRFTVVRTQTSPENVTF